MRYMKGLVMDMNSHTVFGVVKTDPEIRAGKNSDYILAEILDRTSHNGKSNPQNRYSVIMYGERKELEAVKKTILKGKAIYVSGTGFQAARAYALCRFRHVSRTSIRCGWTVPSCPACRNRSRTGIPVPWTCAPSLS